MFFFIEASLYAGPFVWAVFADVAPLVVMERGARAATGIIAEASFGGQGRRRRLRHGAAG